MKVKKARKRLNAVNQAREMIASGMPKMLAAAKVADTYGVCPNTIRGWRRRVANHPPSEWLGLLVQRIGAAL